MATNIRRNLLTGTVTVIPIMVTIFVFSFFLELLSDIGRPKLVILANAVRPISSDLASWLLDVPWLSSAIAIALTIAMLYLLGWSMTRLVGRQILLNVEHGLKRIPLVTTVYGATKKLIDAFRTEGSRAQKVVLVEFPHARMKAVGLVTRNFIDADTGEELAAVYVPTSPNPTGGYLEIVPVAELVLLDWSVDEAMAFVLSGGTTAPERIHFSRRYGQASTRTPTLQSDNPVPERVHAELEVVKRAAPCGRDAGHGGDPIRIDKSINCSEAPMPATR